MTTALTTTDLDLLATCEETIARGLQTFKEVGQALARWLGRFRARQAVLKKAAGGRRELAGAV